MDIETKEITQSQSTEEKDIEVKSGARSPEVRTPRTPIINRDLGDETDHRP